ncbi:MAG: deoxyuridine 5'-triphosphate nucleotidohydrolase [Tenericutes bacterium HGW-Tenericutes-1]|jgi:dUTP pyrophosphatase|nr:MAG: deoxyuridine 5'-triphosphate nucleotidohydrolase [Tenericutes bacterium HGW-Tenericutes-1]
MSQRGFSVVQAYLHQDINLPKRKTARSAGYDFEAASDMVIQPQSLAFIPTGLKAYMGNDEVLYIYARSSLFQNKGLILTNGVGVIDADYFDNPTNEGHILISLYNLSNQIVTIHKGERIAQGVFAKYLLSSQDGFTSTKRMGGFGSTGQ